MSHHENAYFVDTQLITCHAIPLIPAFHTTPMPTRQTPLTARSQHLPKHLSSNCHANTDKCTDVRTPKQKVQG